MHPKRHGAGVGSAGPEDLDSRGLETATSTLPHDPCQASVEVQPSDVREFLTTIAAQAKAAVGERKAPGVLQMSRLHPDTDKLVPSRYEIDDAEQMISDAVADSHAGHNVYIEGRLVRPDLRGSERGKIEDTVAVFALVIDSDADKQMAWSPTVRPSLTVETSPGNFHYWFFLKEAVSTEIGKALGERIRNAAHADHDSGTITQPYRVAGTANYPSKKKREERGRVTVTTKIVEFDPEIVFTPEELERAFPVVERKPNGGAANGSNPEGQVDESSIPADTMATIRNGVGKDADRSNAFFNVMLVLKRIGWTIEGITALLERYPGGIAAKYQGRLRQEIERVYDKIKVQQAPPFVPQEAQRGPEEGVSLSDFCAFMPRHTYIYIPSREMWPAASVNARIPDVPLFDEQGLPLLDKKGNEVAISAAAWLDRNQHVEQMTWAPGRPLLIPNSLIAEGGWIEQNGVTCFNHYRPPIVEPGNAAEADRWIDHVHKVFPNDADHVIQWMAQRVQQPQVKINHGLVLLGDQGIGKDTLLEAVKYAIGAWNFMEASPQQLLGRFNSFLKSVILRVSEARDLGDTDRYAFYDHTKSLMAAPPDVLRCDEKNLPEHSILNCCGVIITSNHKLDGVFLPPDDRRHYVAASDLSRDDFVEDYWSEMWKWYWRGGLRHVAAYLRELDISAFNPKAPPPKTPAFWAIVDAGQAPEDAELADVLDRLGNPPATTLVRIINEAPPGTQDWLKDRRNRRAIPHRMELCGYVAVRNDANKKGLWIINGARQVVYARSTLTVRERFQAAQELASRSDQPGQ
jgi:RepB DNA-primase from phage plasmid/Family of unknown function (DUF5906)